MQTSEISRDAYISWAPDYFVPPTVRQIMALFMGPGVSLSRQQISKKTRMPINGVCGRVYSLIAAGRLEERGERRDPHTNKRQKLLRLPQLDWQSLSPEPRPC